MHSSIRREIDLEKGFWDWAWAYSWTIHSHSYIRAICCWLL